MAQRRRPLIFCILLLALCGFTQDEWVLFSPEEGHFSIRFPVEREAIQQSGGSRNEAGIQEQQWMAIAQGNLYVLSYTTLPPLTTGIDEDIAEKILAEVREGTIRGYLQATFTFEKPVQVGKFTGRDFEIVGLREPDSTRVVSRMRVILTPARMYLMGVITVSENPDASSVDRFFNSFNILNP